jgi:hypothetical protein
MVWMKEVFFRDSIARDTTNILNFSNLRMGYEEDKNYGWLFLKKGEVITYAQACELSRHTSDSNVKFTCEDGRLVVEFGKEVDPKRLERCNTFKKECHSLSAELTLSKHLSPMKLQQKADIWNVVLSHLLFIDDPKVTVGTDDQVVVAFLTTNEVWSKDLQAIKEIEKSLDIKIVGEKDDIVLEITF